MVDQFREGMVLKPATKYQRVAESMGLPAITINVGAGCPLCALA